MKASAFCQALGQFARHTFMGKSQKTPPLAVGRNGKAGDLGAAATRGFSLKDLSKNNSALLQLTQDST
jgi:hypothetical protein